MNEQLPGAPQQEEDDWETAVDKLNLSSSTNAGSAAGRQPTAKNKKPAAKASNNAGASGAKGKGPSWRSGDGGGGDSSVVVSDTSKIVSNSRGLRLTYRTPAADDDEQQEKGRGE